MDEQRNYTGSAFWITLIVVVMTVGMSLIPGFQVGRASVKRVNILSDLIRQEEHPRLEEADLYFDTTFLAEGRAIEAAAAADSLAAASAGGRQAAEPEIRELVWDLPGYRPMPGHDRSGNEGTGIDSAALVAIEDFGGEVPAMEHFYRTMLEKDRRRPVRIAVLGDSFIEGDILTADLREKLQQAYGGGGAGFAPMASPLTAFRRTIKTQSKGWTAYNIMQRKAAPQNLRGHFFVSGWVCQPSEGASTRWENTDYRQRLDSCTAARVFFISPGDSRIELTLNDSLRREFEVEGAAAVRQVTVTAPHIRSLAFKVNSGTEGFIGYGAVFEADGVVVDNYSVRSNNGQAMFWTNPSVNAQINAHAGYDLVILQYGLNIMQTGVHNYTNYARQIEKMVVYVQQCFPTAAVLVLGVSDRSVKTDAGFEPMDAIPYMLDYQRGAAENTGAAFWPTCDAMRSLGGMEQFVANGWAGKDFTHINYAGGRRVAWSLVDAINAGAYEAHAAAEAARIRRQAEQAVLDSVRLLKIDRELRPVSAIGNLNTPRK